MMQYISFWCQNEWIWWNYFILQLIILFASRGLYFSNFPFPLKWSSRAITFINLEILRSFEELWDWNIQIFKWLMEKSNPIINADFYNWNRVKIRYCDGASFSGDAKFYNGVKLSSLYHLHTHQFLAVLCEIFCFWVLHLHPLDPLCKFHWSYFFQSTSLFSYLIIYRCNPTGEVLEYKGCFL